MTSRWRRDALLVVVLAAALRLGLVLISPGGVGGSFGYDASVYYAAADALVHGRLPYRDFLLLHPPGLPLALTPFAEIGRLAGDHLGFVLGNTVFTVVGATCSGLVVRIAHQLRLPRRAGLLGGLFYATWFGAVQAETEARLEPLGSVLFLLALVALLDHAPVSRRRLLLGGLALGGALSVKIWWVVPVLLVLGWLVWTRRRDSLPSVLGLVLSGLVIDGPFLLAAPSAMFRQLVSDQLGRPVSGQSRPRRIEDLATVHRAVPHAGTALLLVLLALAVPLVLATAAAAWRSRHGRLLVVLASAQLAVLVIAPTYFAFYSGYAAGTLALVVATGCASPWRAGRAATHLALGAVVALSVVTLVHRPAFSVRFGGSTALARAVASTPCVVSDTPMALIELDALSRGLSHPDCPNWVDVSGRTYDVDAPPPGHFVVRQRNARWQADLLQYLEQGDAVILYRSTSGIAPATQRSVASHPVLARAGGNTVYSTR